MALTVDGIVVSGSVGANTQSRNRYGAYRRRRTKPVNPNSVLQQYRRQAFRAAIDAWTNDMTAIERQSWETYAAGVPWLNKVGETTHLTGQAMFLRTACYLLFWNGSAAAAYTAPGIFDIGSIFMTIGSLTYDTSANTLAGSFGATVVSNSWQVTGGAVQISISQPANASTNFRPNRFKSVANVDAGAVPATPLVLAASASPWVFTAGQKVWAKVRGYMPDGRLTEEQLLGPATITVVP